MAFLLTVFAVVVLPCLVAMAGLWVRDCLGPSERIGEG